jgi:hypothetical protein
LLFEPPLQLSSGPGKKRRCGKVACHGCFTPYRVRHWFSTQGTTAAGAGSFRKIEKTVDSSRRPIADPVSAPFFGAPCPTGLTK